MSRELERGVNGVLESLGITNVADAVYRFMLDRREWGIPEISASLGLPEVQVREALDELAERRLLRSSSSGGGLRPVSPAVGLAVLLAQAEAEMQARREQIESARAVVAAIVAEHEAAHERDLVVRLEGVDAVRDRLAELAAAATFECLSFNPNTAQTPDAKAASRGLNGDLLSRGVAIRCVYQDSFRNHPLMLEYAEWLTSLGGQARTAPSVPMMMVVFDRRTALLPLDPDESHRGALDISSPGIVAAVCALFEQVWSTATPVGQAMISDDTGLNASQQELLELLGAGHTDESAARKLGVSLTTVRRMMAILMDRLNARSRFQAGVRATERGWLRSPAQ
jgi:DNA-binding CsgD family transcriptional regulator/sugar-specific transcriptional regulator TrmB